MKTKRILDSLTNGEIEPIGRIAVGSNFTFLVKIEAVSNEPQNQKGHKEEEQKEIWGVYKPIKGERPLWDFPPNLMKRERCGYLLSEQLGWNLVPPTVLRDGPAGEGSLQLFIHVEKDFFDLEPEEKTLYREELERLCALDVVMNSTDRKSGHILADKDGKIWAIDNALSFHSDFKLRTVLWDFGGEKIPTSIISDLKIFLDDGLGEELRSHLSPAETAALIKRTEWMIENTYFPNNPGRHSYPWPL